VKTALSCRKGQADGKIAGVRSALPHEQLGCILDNEPFCFKLDVDALTQPDFAVERLNAAQSCARIGSIVEHVAGEDYQLALATLLGVYQRWPGIPITLRQLVRCNGHPVAGARISQSRITFVTKPSTSAITMPKPYRR